jgi:hypothetical protein
LITIFHESPVNLNLIVQCSNLPGIVACAVILLMRGRTLRTVGYYCFLRMNMKLVSWQHTKSDKRNVEAFLKSDSEIEYKSQSKDQNPTKTKNLNMFCFHRMGNHHSSEKSKVSSNGGGTIITDGSFKNRRRSHNNRKSKSKDSPNKQEHMANGHRSEFWTNQTAKLN